MLKKKNIAMVMAAATIATSVAPVFAAVETQDVEKATLIKEVGEKLAVKYSDAKVDGNGGTVATGAEYTNSVYEIKASAGTVFTNTPVESVAHLEQLIEKAEVKNQAITVTITDKGHRTVDGKIVDTYEGKKYAQADLNSTFYPSSAKLTEITNGKSDASKVVVATADVTMDTTTVTDVKKAEITLVGDTSAANKITVELNSAQLDLTTGLDKDGNKVKLSEITTEADAKKVVGFALVAGTDKLDLPSKEVKSLKYNVVKGNLVQFDLSTFMTETGYTEAAKELTGLLKLAGGATANGTKVVTVNKDGKTYKLKYDKTSNLLIESVKDAAGKDAGYKLTIDLTVVENGKDFPSTGTNVQLEIKSKVQADLAALKAEIVAGNEVSTTKYEKLAGDNRFETAVKISEEAHKAKTKKIVLVGENAVVDGLASAPLAKQEGAPILLTKKDTVPTSTMNEIKRLTDKGDKVYLIGGENTISKAVEAQLAKEMNAEIVRLSGNDRYETSLKIAEELDVVNTTDFTKAYVVGGEGLADAMSVAAVAAQTSEPIIVTPAAALNKDAKAFLDARDSLINVDVIGGVSKVSTQVLKDADGIDNVTTVKRIAGTDRNDTNAKVISNYFDAANEIDKVYVAKDQDSQLVDALAAAPLAGKTNKGVIVLSSANLTDAQEAAVKTAKSASNTVTQIGNGISETVMQKVLKALGL